MVGSDSEKVDLNVLAQLDDRVRVYTKSIHHFVVKDGLEVEFNFYDDSQKMAEAMQDIS